MEVSDLPEKKFGVLIHGTGWVATQHAQAVKNNPDAEVVAVSSRRRSSAQRLADQYELTDVGIYDDFDVALRHDGVDIVAICTPQHIHCQSVRIRWRPA